MANNGIKIGLKAYDDLFKTGEHSGVNVGLFIYGLDENDFKDKTVVDNTDICAIIRQYIASYRK